MFAPQPEQVAVQPVYARVRLPLGKIEDAALWRPGIGRIVERRFLLEIHDAGKLGEKFRAPFSDRLRQIAGLIGEVQKGRRRRELLTLEEHGSAGDEQQER